MSKQTARIAVLMAIVCIMAACDRTPSSNVPVSGPPINEPGPAVEARTAATVAQQQVAALEASAREAMQHLIDAADTKQDEGDTHLSNQQYADAAHAFNESAAMYQQVLHGRDVLIQLTSLRNQAAEARLLVELNADADELRPIRLLELNSEGYFEAGDFDAALAELDKARQAYTALLPVLEPAVLDDAVAARTAMLAARALITAQSRQIETGPLPILLAQAQETEEAARRALAQRSYTPARELFVKAEAFYRVALEEQSWQVRVAHARTKAEARRELADSAYHTNIRPASFERGAQLLLDGNTAAAQQEHESAEVLYGSAVEQFEVAQREAAMVNAASDAQRSWFRELQSADRGLLAQHVQEAFDAAQNHANEGDGAYGSGQYEEAEALYAEAVDALARAVDEAVTQQNHDVAKPLVSQLAQKISTGDKFAAIPLLNQLQTMIPADTRMADMRQRVIDMAWPAKQVIDLGGGVTMELLLIRSGSFTMGFDRGQKEELPMHHVTITTPYYFGKTEVTQAQWYAVMRTNPSKFKDMPRPVEQVSWNDCQVFLRKLSDLVEHLGEFSLPTEAQWEYACRAGSNTTFFFGDDQNLLKEYGWYADTTDRKTRFVGEKKPNPWGLYDMYGNVWEWCADWHGSYKEADVIDPVGPAEGISRVFRGGGSASPGYSCRSAGRWRGEPTFTSAFVGLRLAIDLSGLESQLSDTQSASP